VAPHPEAGVGCAAQPADGAVEASPAWERGTVVQLIGMAVQNRIDHLLRVIPGGKVADYGDIMEAYDNALFDLPRGMTRRLSLSGHAAALVSLPLFSGGWATDREDRMRIALASCPTCTQPTTSQSCFRPWFTASHRSWSSSRRRAHRHHHHPFPRPPWQLELSFGSLHRPRWCEIGLRAGHPSSGTRSTHPRPS